MLPIGTYEMGIIDDSAAEIPAYDPLTQQIFVVNAANDAIDVLDASNPTNPSYVSSLVSSCSQLLRFSLFAAGI